jgi:hypothetical protein
MLLYHEGDLEIIRLKPTIEIAAFEPIDLASGERAGRAHHQVPLSLVRKRRLG